MPFSPSWKLQGTLTVSHYSEANLVEEEHGASSQMFFVLSNDSVPDRLNSLGAGKREMQVGNQRELKPLRLP